MSKWQSLGKFDSERDEILYGETPNESESFADDWYGLYLNQHSQGGVILTENSQGFVRSFEFDTDNDINAEWHNIEYDSEQWHAEDQGMYPIIY